MNTLRGLCVKRVVESLSCNRWMEAASVLQGELPPFALSLVLRGVVRKEWEGELFWIETRNNSNWNSQLRQIQYRDLYEQDQAREPLLQFCLENIK